MNISFQFLERILEVPAQRLESFLGLLDRNGDLPDDEALTATLVYAHLMKYGPPESSALLVTKIMAKHGKGLTAISVINKSGLVTNGTDLWDLVSAKEMDPAKLSGIYEQHGLDLVEYSRLLSEAFSDSEVKRAQRRSVGVPRGAQGPAASGAPASPEPSLPGPESASPQP